MSMTQQEKIIITMLRGRREWWLPFDFMRTSDGELFVGYEASARLSELRKEYPDMIESKRDGKYVATRLRREAVAEWFNTLPKYLKQIVAKELDYYPHMPDNKYNGLKADKIFIDEAATLPEQGSLL